MLCIYHININSIICYYNIIVEKGIDIETIYNLLTMLTAKTIQYIHVLATDIIIQGLQIVNGV